jgi:hypothetical protein
MGAYLDMLSRSKYDTDLSQMSERESYLHNAGLAYDAKVRKEERKVSNRALYDAARDGSEHDERCDKENLCRDCLVECFDEESEDAQEDRARDLYHSGQPMGEWDH